MRQWMEKNPSLCVHPGLCHSLYGWEQPWALMASLGTSSIPGRRSGGISGGLLSSPGVSWHPWRTNSNPGRGLMASWRTNGSPRGLPERAQCYPWGAKGIPRRLVSVQGVQGHPWGIKGIPGGPMAAYGGLLVSPGD